MLSTEKTREARLRGLAREAGYRLVKSRSRTPLYAMVARGWPSWTPSWTLDEVELWLKARGTKGKTRMVPAPEFLVAYQRVTGTKDISPAAVIGAISAGYGRAIQEEVERLRS